MAIDLMYQHGLIGDKGWAFFWDNAKRRLGSCNHHRRIISMSKRLVEINDEIQVRDTILHEIAHALVDPALPAHGTVWKIKAQSLGCSAERLAVGAVKVEPTWEAWCPGCPFGFKIKRHRRNYKLMHRTCGKILKWRRI